jgi:hypothetical protein
VAAMLVGTGLFQFVFGAIPAYTTLGVNVVSAVHETAESGGLVANALAASAILAQQASVSHVCLGIVLALATYMLEFQQKGVLHLAVALGCALTAIAYHHILGQQHHWGRLALTSAAINHLSLLRLIFGIFAVLFWLLSVMSFTAYAVRRASDKKAKLA